MMRLAESKKSKKKKKGKADVAEPGAEAAPAPADEQPAVTPPETAAVSSAAAESKSESTALPAEVEEEDGDEAEGEGKVIISSPVSRLPADESVIHFNQKRHTIAVETQYRWQICMLFSVTDQDKDHSANISKISDLSHFFAAL